MSTDRNRPELGEWTGAIGVVLGAVLGAVLAVVGRIAAGVTREAVGPRREQEPAPHPPTMRRPGWSTPQPERLLRPTYWPMVLALGISFIFWGLVSNLIISAIGMILFILALANWIGELRRDA